MLSARQIVELFHLLFVRALFGGLPDRTRIAIKGGINLRFFFQSVRFSEDLDLDVNTISKETVENRVDRILKSPQLLAPLKARGFIVKDITKPKQTTTVQKWKLTVASLDGATEERTKIELSRRDDVDAATSESIDAELAKAYSIPSFLATHYATAHAVRQKIHALADRSETQPRDVFDLTLLLARADAPTSLDEEARGWIDQALTNTASLTYDRYVSLVIAYLDPAHAELYGSEEAWNAMQLDLSRRLEALK